jgi:hypothetical protein
MQEATVESIEHIGAGDNVILRFVGGTDETRSRRAGKTAAARRRSSS